MSLDSKKDELKGAVNEKVGKATGDDKKELKGKAEGMIGKTKEKIDEFTDKIAKKVNSDKN